MTSIQTDTAIMKLKKMNCKIFRLQFPFIIFSRFDSFYKCYENDIMNNDSIYSILETSLPLITIKDLK